MPRTLKNLRSNIQRRSASYASDLNRNPYSRVNSKTRKRRTSPSTKRKIVDAIGLLKSSEPVVFKPQTPKTLKSLKKNMKQRLIYHFKLAIDQHNTLHPENAIPYTISNKDGVTSLLMQG